ncbi:DUF3857 domain-containing protein [Rhodohalobacter mucosus]|uniref:Uncharacterized protein n=1 Tax=Rhodohalobacter mucosus TaxID=2079485 RepID=A0A316TN86_9BACT|nr:DUF3857 domain-containing protein [Rhodohalobacter mucosus]PWN06073.1 hypothetical protein DDZ15_09455 [Rhodohalobacter mucosus]
MKLLRLSILFLLILSGWFPMRADVAGAQNITMETEVLEQIEIFDRFGNIFDQNFNESGYPGEPWYFQLKETVVRFDRRPQGITAFIDYLVRIRITTDDPLRIAEASLVGIPYYFQENMERVINLEGYTYQPDGERSYFSGEDAAVVDLNSRYKILEFQMPDVKEGSVIEYKYTLVRRYIEELPDVQFSHQVPVKKVNLYMKNEPYLRYQAVEENIDFDLNYTETRVDTSSIPMVFTYRRPEPVFIQQWSAEDIPAVDAAAYVSSVDDVRGKLKFQISEFGNPRQPLENSWEFVAAQIQRTINPFKMLAENTALTDLGSSLYSDLGTSEARIDSLFHYVNSRVQFNNTGSVFADSGLSHVLRGEPADQAEINMVLLALLRGSGFEAYPLYISGREFGRINLSFPSLYQFNRMLVVARKPADNEWIFMDASFSHSLPGLIPVESFSEQGMILKENEYEWTEIEPEKSFFGLDVNLEAQLSENGTLSGEFSGEVSGYPSRILRRDIALKRPLNEILKQLFFDSYPEAELRNASVSPLAGNRNVSVISADFVLSDYAVTYTEGMDYRPMVVGYLFSNPFEKTERRVPISLDAPETLSIDYRITLPEGYRFDVSGETRSTSLPGAQLFEEYLLFDNRIEYLFDIEITTKEFPADAYAQLRQIYDRWVALSNNAWFIERNP